MKVYLSGKITGLPNEEAKSNFNKAGLAVVNQLGDIYKDIEIVNPMVEVPFEEGKTWEDYMADDLLILQKCDAIFMLPNFKDSQGAKLELAMAQRLKMPIIFGGVWF